MTCGGGSKKSAKRTRGRGYSRQVNAGFCRQRSAGRGVRVFEQKEKGCQIFSSRGSSFGIEELVGICLLVGKKGNPWGVIVKQGGRPTRKESRKRFIRTHRGEHGGRVRRSYREGNILARLVGGLNLLKGPQELREP